MLQQLVESPGERDPAALHDAFRTELAAVVEEVGVGAAAADTGLDEAVLSDVSNTEDLSLAAAAAVLSLDGDRPDAEAIRQESLDHVLLGMTTAVLDVDAVAANVDLGLSPTEVQQRIEGRTEMTLREYAHVLGFVESRKR